MLWAIFSDIHGRSDRLGRVLRDAQQQGATRYLCLGDVGSMVALDLLADVGALCVFGNWEASGLRGMASPYRQWVAHWPAQLRLPELWAAHASPIWPPGLEIAGVVDYMRQRDLRWPMLFPSLQHSEEARVAAWAELDAGGGTIFFHGHTHVQEAWLWRPEAAPLRTESSDVVTVGEGDRCLVGVGSVGMPHDGNGACYVLYDDVARCVEWRRI